MAPKGSKGRKNPPKQRKSTRNKKRSEKGEYYDEFILKDSVSPDIITSKVDKEGDPESDDGISATQSTPEPILVPTPMRTLTAKPRETDGVDLMTELAVAEAAEETVECSTDVPETVAAVNETEGVEEVEEMQFNWEERTEDQDVNLLLSSIYELYQLYPQIAEDIDEHDVN